MKKVIFFILFGLIYYQSYSQNPKVINQGVYKIIFKDSSGFQSGFTIDNFCGIYTSLHGFLDVLPDTNFNSYLKKIDVIYNPAKRKFIKIDDNLSKIKIKNIDCSRDLLFIEFIEDDFLQLKNSFKYKKEVVDTFNNLSNKLFSCGFYSPFQIYSDHLPVDFSGRKIIFDELRTQDPNNIIEKIGIPSLNREVVSMTGNYSFGFSGGPTILSNYYVIGINSFSFRINQTQENYYSFAVLLDSLELKSFNELNIEEKTILNDAPINFTKNEFYRKYNDLAKECQILIKSIQPSDIYSKDIIKYSKQLNNLATDTLQLYIRVNYLKDTIAVLSKYINRINRKKNPFELDDPKYKELQLLHRKFKDSFLICKNEYERIIERYRKINDKKNKTTQKEIYILDQKPEYLKSIIKTIKLNNPNLITRNAEITRDNWDTKSDENKQFIYQEIKYSNYSTSLYLKTLNNWYRYLNEKSKPISLNCLDSAVNYACQLKYKIDTSIFPSSLFPNEEKLWKKYIKKNFISEARFLINVIAKEIDCPNVIKKGICFESKGEYHNALRQYLLACKNKCSNDAFDYANKMMIKIDSLYLYYINKGNIASNNNMFDNALKYYQNALFYKPLEKLVQEKIDTVSKRMKYNDNYEYFRFMNLGKDIENYNNEILVKHNIVYSLPNISLDVNRYGTYNENILIEFKFGHLDSMNAKKINLSFYSYNYLLGEYDNNIISTTLKTINLMLRQNLIFTKDFMLKDSTQIKFIGKADAIPFKGEIIIDKQLDKTINNDLICDTNNNCYLYHILKRSQSSLDKNTRLAYLRAYIAKNYIGFIDKDLINEKNISINVITENNKKGGEYRGVEIIVLIKLDKNKLSVNNQNRILNTSQKLIELE